MPYNLRGIMDVPRSEGPFPVVLITHGSHSNDDETKRFDSGFDYLVETLARNGMIAISMDMSKPYTWKYGDPDDREKTIYLGNDHFDNLIRANNGEETGYPNYLNHKIDLGKIALIGHSRGG